jgi:hypothetical protein
MSSTSQLFRKYKRGGLLIETGTDTGAGIVAAFAAGYSKVISIEIDHGSVEYWNTRIVPSVPELTVLEGDSAMWLKSLLFSDVAWQTATVWLDAHTAKETAVLRELDVLAPRADFFGYLLIDDMRLFRSGQEWAHGMKESDVVDRLAGWKTTYEATPYDPQDVLVAWRFE